MPIPEYTPDGVLPLFDGDTICMRTTSPFPVTTLELCEKLGATPARRQVLRGLLELRALLHQLEVVEGFQWVDGTFVEDVERRTRKSPDHVRVVTFCQPSPLMLDPTLSHVSAPLKRMKETRVAFRVDHTIVRLDWPADQIVEHTRYWSGLMSHQTETGLWKGMLKINLNTQEEDAAAKQHLASLDRP